MTSLERILQTPLRAERRGGNASVKVTADGYHVATVSPGMNDAGDYARLFAAAPDLLVALKNLRAEIELISGFWTEGLDNFAMQADQAIAKAERGNVG
jgi:hypothetical protein